MEVIPFLREIRHTYCDLEGGTEGGTDHKFIILSKRGYNEKSNSVNGVPLTSKSTHFSLNFGIPLTDDDLEGEWPFKDKKTTFVLCDRVCRIKKDQIREDLDITKIKDSKRKEILEHLNHFLEKGIKKSLSE